MPVAHDVLAIAAASPRRVAVRCDDRVWRYDRLAARVEAAARALRTEYAVRSGHLVAISVADPPQALAAMLAVDLLGATPLVCDSRWTSDHRRAVLSAVGVDAAVAGWGSPSAPGGAGAFGSPRPTDRAWAGFSSGSAGRPRAIVRTRVSWSGSFPAVSELTGIGPGSEVLVPGPLSASLGAFAVAHALSAGATVELGSRWSPRRLAQRVDACDVAHLVPSALAQALDVNRRPVGRRRVAFVGGAALPETLRDRAVEAGVDVVAYYGATELSFVAVDCDGTGLRPFPQVEVQVRPLSPDVGQVWVRSPWLSQGYLAGSDGPLRRDAAGWATVGDLADFAGADAPLVLRGRADSAIVTAGVTVVPEDVEAAFAGLPELSGIVVVATPHERLGAVVTAVVEPGAGPVRRAALDALAGRRLAPAQRPRRWWTVDRLPRTATGKPARGLIAERLRSGTLPVRRLS